MQQIKNLYSAARKNLPAPVRVGLSKFLLTALGKPLYIEQPGWRPEKAVVCLSADFELAWAWRFAKKPVDVLAFARQERESFFHFIKIFEEFSIPITWATVGHLFLDSCKRHHGRAHADMPRPEYFENRYWRYNSGDWYDLDPCTDFKTNPEFYGPDLIERIIASPVAHEIGCHSFSHCSFADEHASAELAECELRACEDAMARFGIKPVSFVFPGNFYGNFSVFKKYGYLGVRYKTNALKEIGFPETLADGLCAVHDSLAFDIDEPGWEYKDIVWKLTRYIEKSIEKKAVCHLWFHPSLSEKEIYGYFYPVIQHIAQRREAGLLEVMTMKELAGLQRLYMKRSKGG